MKIWRCDMAEGTCGAQGMDAEGLSPTYVKRVTLYRYFAYAAQMRKFYSDFMGEEGKQWIALMADDRRGPLAFLYSIPGLLLMYSYSALYLVAEGWDKLKLRDAEIDGLLASPFLLRLRRFRNATFHFQNDPFSPKHFEFFGTEEEETEVWLMKLYRAFEVYFRDLFDDVPDVVKQLADGSLNHAELAKAIMTHWDKLSGEERGALPGCPAE